MQGSNDRFVRNMAAFCRGLRSAGLPVGPGRIADALDAVARVGVERRADMHAALRAVLVTDAAQFALFERAFRLFFDGSPALAGAAPDAREAARRAPEAAPLRGDDARAAAGTAADGAGTASDREAFRRKDFEYMTPDEEAALRDYLRHADYPLPERATRRYLPRARGDRYDLRRTLAAMPRHGGELTGFAKRQRRRRPADVVLLCDVSGSMSRYTRAFLLFAHAIVRRHSGVRTFVFATRLTAIDRHLAMADVDSALARIAADVPDRDGGTRIAASIARFNRDWARRVLARGAAVVLLTDGLERRPDGELAAQTAVLRRSCRQLVWMNPMLRYEGFEPRAAGIREMLPHVDRFLPAHNLDCFDGLCRALAGAGRARVAA